MAIKVMNQRLLWEPFLQAGGFQEAMASFQERMKRGFLRRHLFIMASEERKSSWRPFDQFPSGVCLISMDDSERILYANRELLFMYSSKDQESFLRDVRSYRGMVQSQEYVPLADMYERRLPGENLTLIHI